MIQFSVDAGATWKTLADFGLIAQPGHAHSFVPDVINNPALIAGVDGEFDFGARLGVRPFDLPLAFPYEATTTEMQIKGRAFAAYLSDGNGRPITLWIRFEYELDKYYSVRYSGAVVPSRNLQVATFNLPMIAYDPYAYQISSTSTITWDSYVSMDSTLTFDDVYSTFFSASGSVNINNFGTLDEWPIIQIVGSFTTFSITANGLTLVYGEALVAGTLTIDCKKMTSKLGITNKNNKVSGDWIKLLQGINSVTVTGTGLNCQVSFIFRPKYL